ncbi:hypothetical protein B0H19DRAFT_189412 [Mycena capillaripes]|nr:hypothetical protein B0H19DRAFT_189412 [Mycena capillaripes]
MSLQARLQLAVALRTVWLVMCEMLGAASMAASISRFSGDMAILCAHPVPILSSKTVPARTCGHLPRRRPPPLLHALETPVLECRRQLPNQCGRSDPQFRSLHTLTVHPPHIVPARTPVTTRTIRRMCTTRLPRTANTTHSAPVPHHQRPLGHLLDQSQRHPSRPLNSSPIAFSDTTRTTNHGVRSTRCPHHRRVRFHPRRHTAVSIHDCAFRASQHDPHRRLHAQRAASTRQHWPCLPP